MAIDSETFIDSAGDRIAFHHVDGSPTIVFLSGFRSDMSGDKATFVERLCRENGWGCQRFDYHAHGESPGDFRDGSIGRWTRNAIDLISAVTDGPLILAGSSMGGWIALHVALALPERVQAIVGIAAAPDFTEDLMLPAMTPQQRTELETGEALIPSAYGEPYPITRLLIEEGRKQLLLHGDKLPIRCPVRLLHGMHDPDVPWQRAGLLASKLESPDVQIELITDGDHRLSCPADLERLAATLERLIRPLASHPRTD